MTTLRTSRNLLTGHDWPETYLPENPTEWRRRVRDLIAELRRTDLNPSRGHLYAQNDNGDLMACIEGVINDMAIEGGVPATWVDMEIDGPDEEPLTVWEVMPPETGQGNAVEYSNRALPEALLYHGFDMPDGNFVIDALDGDVEFIREVINGRHGASFGVDPGAGLNDSLVKQGVNPLLLAADILEHLLDKPLHSAWHERINAWADRGQSAGDHPMNGR